MKLIILFSALIMSASVFAKDVKTTISDIEIERSAQCTETNTSIAFCFNQVCINYVTFQCIENTGDFKVRLKVVIKQLANGSYRETVKKVIYIK